MSEYQVQRVFGDARAHFENFVAKKFGKDFSEHFNAMPIGFMEVASGDFNYRHNVEFLNMSSTAYVVYRQLTRNKAPSWFDEKRHLLGEFPEGRGITFFLMQNGFGYGIAWPWGRDTQMRFFICGCEHEWSSTRLGNHLHRATCTKCGYSEEIDSSG